MDLWTLQRLSLGACLQRLRRLTPLAPDATIVPGEKLEAPMHPPVTVQRWSPRRGGRQIFGAY